MKKIINFQDALAYIRMGHVPGTGYRVSFDWKDGRFLEGGYFPAGDEPPFPTEEIAWAYAHELANNKVTKNVFVNIKVTYENFTPVPNYDIREIKNRKIELISGERETRVYSLNKDVLSYVRDVAKEKGIHEDTVVSQAVKIYQAVNILAEHGQPEDLQPQELRDGPGGCMGD